MANALKVALKNQAGQYLMPYTNNLPVDESPVIGSENYLKSGAVAQALNGKEAAGTAANLVAGHGNDANAHAGKFDPAGTAANLVAGHGNDANAHAGKFDPAGTAMNAVAGHVNDVNAHYGRFDPAGSAANAVAGHDGAGNPHAGKFDPAGSAVNAVAGHDGAGNPHAGKFDPAGSVASHNGDANAHAALFAGNLKNPIAIPEGANLNDYFAPGVYIAYTDTIAASVLNSATQFAFTLIVLKTAGSANGSIQIQMDYANQTINKRTYGYDWSAWKKILCDDGADFVIAQWTSTDNSCWYRKYKSGWVEQGGYIASGITSVTFPIAFTAHYSLQRTRHTTTSSDISDISQNIAACTNSGFTVNTTYAPTYGSWWYACGL